MEELRERREGQRRIEEKERDDDSLVRSQAPLPTLYMVRESKPGEWSQGTRLG